MSKDLTEKFQKSAEPTEQTLRFILSQPGLVDALIRQGAAPYPGALSVAAAAARNAAKPKA